MLTLKTSNGYDDSDAVQSKINEAISTGQLLVIETPLKADGKTLGSYQIKKPIIIEPSIGKQCSVSVVCAGSPSGLFAWRGNDGASIFKSFGLKRCSFENLTIRSYASSVRGFDVSADASRNSTSGNSWRGFRFDSADGTTHNDGFYLGSGLEGADISQNLIERGDGVAELGGPTKDLAFLLKCQAAGHRAFVFGNSNNLDNLLVQCGGYGQHIVFDHGEKTYGGNGNRYESPHPSFSVLGWRLPGGFSISIEGGRSEHMRGLVLHGDPLVPGRGDGRLSFRNHLSGGAMGLDQTFDLLDPNIMFALNNQAQADLSGTKIYNPAPAKDPVKIMYAGSLKTSVMT